MSDYSKLASLADAIHGPGSTMQMLARWRAFENACHPALIKELIADVDRLKAENESLRADAERYRWLRDEKGLSLRSDGSKWTRSNGDQFICSHHLCAFDTSYAPFESLDEVVDAAISYPENPS